MKAQQKLFRVYFGVSLVLLLVGGIINWADRCQFAKDIILAVFGGTVVAAISAFVFIKSEREQIITRVLFQIRNIKLMHNQLVYASSKSEMRRLCREIDKSFMSIQDNYGSIIWTWKRDKLFDELPSCLMKYFGYVNALLIALEEEKTEEEIRLCKGELDLDGNKAIIPLMNLWLYIALKYKRKLIEDSIQLDKAENTLHGRHRYMTLEELKRNQEENKNARKA